MVEHQPSKLITRVRFPSPAPSSKKTDQFGLFLFYCSKFVISLTMISISSGLLSAVNIVIATKASFEMITSKLYKPIGLSIPVNCVFRKLLFLGSSPSLKMLEICLDTINFYLNLFQKESSCPLFELPKTSRLLRSPAHILTPNNKDISF